MSYDPRKAALYNKLIKDGLSQDAAIAQAGLSDADFGSYAIGSNGELGAIIAGTGQRADVEVVTSRTQPSRVRYAQDPDGSPADPPPAKNVTYTTTSTETVSGGGSTTVVAGPRQANAQSRALGNAYDAKNAEYNQFVKDNPSDFARRRQGLPPLTPEESQQRQERLNQLNREKESLKNQQIDAETPGTPSVVTTPNTTTTTTTVTTSRVAANEQVNIQNDEAQFQQSEQQLQAQTPQLANASAARVPATVDTELSPVAVTVDQEPAAFQPQGIDPDEDPFEASRLAAEEQANAPGPTEADLNVDPLSDEAILAQQEIQAANRAAFAAENFQPEPVDTNRDPGLSDEETLARQNPGGLSDEEILARAQANSEADTKAKLLQAKQQATLQERFNQTTKGDWRVRLRLAPDANYLYQDSTNKLLSPLKVSDGVVFPYTPIINTNYSAKYDPYDLTHSNYRGYFYRSSQVSEISLQATFTAQDTREAEYVLAVIHFFKSATKMFYGQDPQRGAPPPLVYLSGYGEYQFNNHACVISNFQYNLPNDVDYISISPNNIGLNLSNRLGQVGSSPTSTLSSAVNRLGNLFNVISGQPGVPRGAKPGERTDLGIVSQTVNGTGQTSYVPTKIDLSITLLPVQTRSQVSKQFSVKEFSNGSLLRKGFW